MEKKIIVTGGTGFLGRHVIQALNNKKVNVIALVRDKCEARKINELSESELIEYDINNKSKFPDVKGSNKLIHCAWEEVRNTSSCKHITTYLPNHLHFLQNSIMKGIDKVLITGSYFEYGSQEGAVNSSQKVDPNTSYAFAKVELHKQMLKFKLIQKFDLIWARVFHLYGENQAKDTVLSMFDDALKNQEKIFNMTGGEQLIDFIPVDEAAEMLVKLFLIAGVHGTFNVCRGKPLKLKDFMIKRMKEKKKKIILGLGFYDYRATESKGIWGEDSIRNQIKQVISKKLI